MTEEQIELLLNQYQLLIKKVLRETNVYESHNSYEDYYQELSIKLIEIAKKFEGDLFVGDKYQFVSYAQKGLNWYLLDLLRSDSSYNHEFALSEFTFIEDNTKVMPDKMLSFYAEVRKRLNSEEFIIFKGIANNYTLKEIAEWLKVSPTTIAKKKRRLVAKLNDLKHILLL